MSIHRFFRQLKRSLLFSDAEALHARGRRWLQIAHQLSLQQNRLCRSHLDHLEHPDAVNGDGIVFGYSLEKAARKLEPRIIGHDFSRPTLCMVCSGDEYARQVETGTKTKLDYCGRHGYNLAILETLPYRYERHPAWLKIPLLFRLMQMGYQDLFCLDADSLITNPRISLETFFNRLERSGRHLMLAEDVFSLNTGSLFIRKTWQALTLLDLIYESDPGPENDTWEQQALIDLVEQNPSVKSLLYIETNARLFNSMPFDRPAPGLPTDCSAYAWQPGDFLCHFAGTRNGSELSSHLQKFQARMPSSGGALEA